MHSSHSQMDYPQYRHEPLPRGDFIRILHVDSSVNHRQPFCTFENIALNTRSHHYTAISYTWGDTKPVRQIPCSEGQFLSLSKTLSDLFDVLLRRGRSFTVWIDALCINQKEPTEKAHQVKLMGNVYSNAHMVLVWLGEEDYLSRMAFHYMRTDTEPPWFLSNAAMYRVDAMMALLSRRWFRRVWVLQEAILNPNTWVACGSDIIDFQTFKEAVKSLWTLEDAVEFFDVRYLAYRGLRCATRLYGLQSMFRETGKVPLESLFEAVLYSAATDSRDFVFAIQGIADFAELLPIPDYTVSVEKVFVDTAEVRISICIRQDAFVLALELLS